MYIDSSPHVYLNRITQQGETVALPSVPFSPTLNLWRSGSIYRPRLNIVNIPFAVHLRISSKTPGLDCADPI